MPRDPDPPFLANPYSEPVVLKINGRASYLNSSPVSQFFSTLIKQGKREFAVDFDNCEGMDSTFLGILAGAALELRKASPPGTLMLCRMGPRNLELARNLGLHKIAQVDAGDFPMSFSETKAERLAGDSQEAMERARMILDAHRSLSEIDDANKPKFQDVIAFLKNQIDQS